MTCEDTRPAVGSLGLDELSAVEVAQKLELQPHPEGGFFRETYRSAVEIETEAGLRPTATAILYLLTAQDPSRFHRLRSDEVWFYHAGAPAELILLRPRSAEHQIVGLDLPQVVVPAASWMAARVLSQDQADWGAGRAPERRWTPDRRWSPSLHWTLVSCVVSPGFDYADFDLGAREALLRDYPQARKEILALT